MEIFWSIVISILSGAAGAMGIGGGSVFLLYLTAFAGMDQMKAQGINLVFFIPIAVIALVIHCKNHLVRWRTALFCLLAGIPAVFAGFAVANYLGSDLLRKAFAVFLLLLGIKELFFGKKRRMDGEKG